MPWTANIAGERVAERDAGARRRLAREAVDVAEAAHRLRDGRVARALGVRARSGRSRRCGPGRCPGSRPRAARSRGSTARACRGGSSRRRRRRRGRARAGAPGPVGCAEVERDALLVPRLHGPPQRPALVARLAPVAQRVGLSGRLDLDHLGAHVAQQPPGERPREQRAELDHAHARERARTGVAACRTGSPGRPAAVDGENVPRDERRLVRGEEDDGADDVRRRADAPDGQASQHVGAKRVVLEHGARQRGVDERRRDRVDGDARPAPTRRRAPGRGRSPRACSRSTRRGRGSRPRPSATRSRRSVPAPARAGAAANARQVRYVPRRFVSTTRSKSSIGCSSVGPGRLSPAAVTQMARPSLAAAVSTSRSTSWESARRRRTSPRARRARRTSAATAASSSSERENSVSVAPASARASAAARPIPRPAPVTIACRPSSRCVGSIGSGAAVTPRAPTGAAPARRTPDPCDRSARPPALATARGTRVRS